MEDFSQFAEHTVKKEESKFLPLYKILFPILALLGSAFLCIALMTLLWIELSIIISIIIFIGLLAFSSRFMRNVEFDYRITNGELYFAEIYNKKKRLERGYLVISRLEAIAPYKGKYKDSADRIQYDDVFDFTSSLDSPSVYYAISRDENKGTVSIFLFEPTDKMLKLLRFYNRNTVIL